MSNTTNTIQNKNGMKNTLSIAKARFFTWIRSIISIHHNNTEIQKIIDHQNQEIAEMRLLVNFLLKNTNRKMRRQWLRYLDVAQEVGIWDATIVKLMPNDTMLHNRYIGLDCGRNEQEIVNLMTDTIPEEGE